MAVWYASDLLPPDQSLALLHAASPQPGSTRSSVAALAAQLQRHHHRWLQAVALESIPLYRNTDASTLQFILETPHLVPPASDSRYLSCPG